MISRDGKEHTEKLPPQRSGYVYVYENMLKAIRGEDYSPKAIELARDVAVAQAAYVSSRERRLVRLDEPEWII